MVKMNCGAMPPKLPARVPPAPHLVALSHVCHKEARRDAGRKRLREAREPGEGEAGPDQQEDDGAAGEPGRDLPLLGHLTEPRAEVAVHGAELLGRGSCEELAAGA